MLKFLRSLLDLIVLAICINIIFQHGQAMVLQAASVGWTNAIQFQWRTARLFVLGAIAVVIIVGLVEFFFAYKENKDQTKRDNEATFHNALLLAIAKRVGVPDEELQSAKEILNGKHIKKIKTHSAKNG